jgi:hypothetical protein
VLRVFELFPLLTLAFEIQYKEFSHINQKQNLKKIYDAVKSVKVCGRRGDDAQSAKIGNCERASSDLKLANSSLQLDNFDLHKSICPTHPGPNLTLQYCSLLPLGIFKCRIVIVDNLYETTSWFVLPILAQTDSTITSYDLTFCNIDSLNIVVACTNRRIGKSIHKPTFRLIRPVNQVERIDKSKSRFVLPILAQTDSTICQFQMLTR